MIKTEQLFRFLELKINKYMIKQLKYFIILFFLVVGVSSCKYQKLLKSSDNDLKYEKAKEYYEDGDYAKSMGLYEQLIPIFRGTEKGEEVSYYYAHCNYSLKDYEYAGHYFRKFANSFPNSYPIRMIPPRCKLRKAISTTG